MGIKIEIDSARLDIFIKNLCLSNLRSPHVHCCSLCPVEGAILARRPELGPLFERKREMVIALPTSKWGMALRTLSSSQD